MKLRRLTSSIIILVKFDQLPFLQLFKIQNFEKILTKFKFAQPPDIQETPTGTPLIRFVLGTYEHGEQEYTIKRVDMEERKIVINVEGPSEIAIKIYDELRELLRGLVVGDLDADFMEPVVKTYETEMVVELEFNAKQLLNQKYMEFIDKNFREAANTETGIATVALHSTVFKIFYKLAEEKLREYRIALSNKEFMFGPREGTALKEQIFVAKAPLASHTIISLLEDLELLFK